MTLLNWTDTAVTHIGTAMKTTKSVIRLTERDAVQEMIPPKSPHGTVEIASDTHHRAGLTAKSTLLKAPKNEATTPKNRISPSPIW